MAKSGHLKSAGQNLQDCKSNKISVPVVLVNVFRDLELKTLSTSFLVRFQRER